MTPLFALLTLVAWSFSDAVGSSPDDDFHLPSIWCGMGERPGLCEDFGDPVQRMVPEPLITSTCYAFDSNKSDACWNSNTTKMTIAGRANIDGLYPPVFYAVMAPFASQDVPTAVVTMRILNSVFAVGLLTGVFFALPRRLRPALLISVLVTSVPLGLFLFASTNPSSWAILSAATVWICLYGSMIAESPRRSWTLAALTVFGAFIGAGARADAAIFAVFGVIIALMLGLRRRPIPVPALVGAVVSIGLSVAFYLSASQSSAVTGGLSGDAPPLTLAEHTTNFLGVPSLWAGALGTSGLGWLDTPMPPAVWVFTLLVLGGVFFLGLKALPPRHLLAVVGAFAALWVVPFAMLALSHAKVGTQVQPRYILPLLVIAVGIVAASPAKGLWTGTRIAFGGLALAGAAAIALQFNIRRYTTGLDVTSLDPGAHAEWWWTAVAPSPLTVWLIGAVSFTLLFAALWFAVASPTLARERVERESAALEG
ncbi:DUF2142 domain-containing protein [Microbacterium sp. 22303]|uniref:DUF2142 domain-containing protein n=1 Tax=Microbacterium sp. 22303 TaxID=3453905 RepID=UPI003F842A4D